MHPRPSDGLCCRAPHAMCTGVIFFSTLHLRAFCFFTRMRDTSLKDIRSVAMTTDSDTDTDVEKRFAADVAQLAACAKVPLLCRVIERRAVIEKLRARGIGWPKISTLLTSVEIHITPNGLRTYASRISRAVRELEAAGEAAPSDERIYEICRERARPAPTARGQPAALQYPDQGRAAKRQARPPTTRPDKKTTSQSTLIRNPHTEL